jgi:mRNA interferase MazF
MRRGEVWVVNLNPNRGAEAGKVRPALILQDTAMTAGGLPTVLVAPLTTQVRPALEPLRVRLPARDKLRQSCHVMVDQTRALDRARFGDGPLTTLTADEMQAVERSLRVVLGMY